MKDLATQKCSKNALSYGIVLFVFAMLFSCDSLAGLKDIYQLRVKSNHFLNEKKFDSASKYLYQLVSDTIFANATDFLNLSCCRLHVMDTVGFKVNLIHSIEKDGADSAITVIYFRSLDSNNKTFFLNYFQSIYQGYRAIFLKKVDLQVEQEMKEIVFLDQLCRKTDDKLYPTDTSSINSKCIRIIGHFIDSVNFVRVSNLINNNKYPDYKNYGITCAKYNTILMHVTDIGEEQWNFIFNYMKKQLACGAMMQNEVVAIASRHYRKKNCTYYGSEKWGLTVPCDCEQVDKLRAEIGLDSLKEEFARLKQRLPECYHEQ